MTLVEAHVQRGVPLGKCLLSALVVSCFLEGCCLQRIGVAMNKELSNIAAHVGEVRCAKRLWTRAGLCLKLAALLRQAEANVKTHRHERAGQGSCNINTPFSCCVPVGFACGVRSRCCGVSDVPSGGVRCGSVGCESAI